MEGVDPRSRTKESEEAVKAAPKIIRGLLMGGYFIGRPMDPESRPAKTKKAKAESRIKSHGLGWRHADQGPIQRRDSSRRSPSTTRSSNLEGQDLE